MPVVGVRPIVFGLAFAEMARLAIPPLARWAAGAHDRSERLWRAARIIALALAAFQAMEMAKGMERLDDIAPSPGPMFRLGVVVAIVGATAFLIWLARVVDDGKALDSFGALDLRRINRCPGREPAAAVDRNGVAAAPQECRQRDAEELGVDVPRGNRAGGEFWSG